MATSSKKTTTSPRKRTAAPGAKAAKSAPEVKVEPDPVAETPEPTLVTVTEPVVTEPDLKKSELIDLVVERSEIKKKFAKPVVEAMLAVLGETIAEGRELNLQPLGKLRINRSEEKSNGRVIVCKLRQSLSTGPGTDDGEDNDAEASDLTVAAAE